MDDEKLNDEADYYWRTLIQSPTAMRNIYKQMLRDSAALLSLREENARLEADNRMLRACKAITDSGGFYVAPTQRED